MTEFFQAAMCIGRRLAPQCPGALSKTPATGVPQLLQLPWPFAAAIFQVESSYQSRPIRISPQLWQYVLEPSKSWTLPV